MCYVEDWHFKPKNHKPFLDYAEKDQQTPYVPVLDWLKIPSLHHIFSFYIPGTSLILLFSYIGLTAKKALLIYAFCSTVDVKCHM